MTRIVITRPNGETEYAELTTDKNLAGNDRLAVEKAGTVYYAKLGNGVSTHMYVIQPDGRKLYVQKEMKFVWEYAIDDDLDKAKNMVIPRTGKYKLVFHTFGTRGREGEEEVDDYYDKIDVFSIGTIFKDGKINSTSGTSYSVRVRNRYGHPLDDDYENTQTILKSIEYIGA